MGKAEVLSVKPGPYVKMLVADEFRMEQSGKVLAIGLYSDSVVVLTIPKNAPKPTKETPIGFDGVSLLLTIGGIVGETSVRFGLEGGQAIEHRLNLQSGTSANIIVNIKPFRIASFGVKNVIVELAGSTHKLHFEVRAKYIEAVDDLENYVSIRQDAPVPGTRTVEPSAAKSKPARKRRPKTVPD
ncbi:hypothetical protein H6G33_37975 [Calothrix sp. FACHB-1219]|uniref:hypothetical protein n=1 Tax=Calothrix sp. FACHB-1219 TaxID=2692778 RepID=UPI0016841CAD|nr:hypothetical protein [Calothrix sp. FACHB-1219]